MTQNIESTEATPTAILRLLSGVLRGGEFVLAKGITLIVARSPQALQHDAGQAEFPDNAIFVPVDDEGGNFEVEVSAQEDGTVDIALRDLNVNEAADEAAYTPNTVRRIAGLDIALRAQDEAWSDEALVFPPVTQVRSTDAEINPVKKSKMKNHSGRVKFSRNETRGFKSEWTVEMAKQRTRERDGIVTKRLQLPKETVSSTDEITPQMREMAKLFTAAR